MGARAECTTRALAIRVRAGIWLPPFDQDLLTMIRQGPQAVCAPAGGRPAPEPRFRRRLYCVAGRHVSLESARGY